jgi:hypothetical protein
LLSQSGRSFVQTAGVADDVFAAKGEAASAKQAADLSKHLGYSEKYGKGGVKEL